MKSTNIVIGCIVVVLVGVYLFTQNTTQKKEASLINNVTVVNGQQIIEITAKGGYEPRKSVAKTGLPTIIRFDTNGTFDCSSSVRIPSMNISQALPPSGTTDIDIGSQKVTTLQGTCGMGMYPFEIDFQG